MFGSISVFFHAKLVTTNNFQSIEKTGSIFQIVKSKFEGIKRTRRLAIS